MSFKIGEHVKREAGTTSKWQERNKLERVGTYHLEDMLKKNFTKPLNVEHLKKVLHLKVSQGK